MSARRQLHMSTPDVFLNWKISLELPDENHVKQISFEPGCRSNARVIRIITCFNDRLVHFYGGESDA